MSEYSLYCNFKKCRTAITSYAWVTSCSHAFCEEHSNHESGTERRCPACESPLKSKYDLVRADLNPSEEFKSVSIITNKALFLIFELFSPYFQNALIE